MRATSKGDGKQGAQGDGDSASDLHLPHSFSDGTVTLSLSHPPPFGGHDTLSGDTHLGDNGEMTLLRSA